VLAPVLEGLKGDIYFHSKSIIYHILIVNILIYYAKIVNILIIISIIINKITLKIKENNNNSKIWFDVIERERLYVGGGWNGIWFDVFEKDINNKAERAEAPPASKCNQVTNLCSAWK